MAIVSTAVVLWCCTAPIARAQSTAPVAGQAAAAQAVLERFIMAGRQGDWAAAADCLSPEALTDFRAGVLPGLISEGEPTLVARFFLGEEVTAEFIEGLDDKGLLIELQSGMRSRAPAEARLGAPAAILGSRVLEDGVVQLDLDPVPPPEGLPLSDESRRRMQSIIVRRIEGRWYVDMPMLKETVAVFGAIESVLRAGTTADPSQEPR
jgi:hypothetical protein